MIKNLVTFGLALAALSSSLQAKVGDTFETMVKTYGPSRWTGELPNGALGTSEPIAAGSLKPWLITTTSAKRCFIHASGKYQN
jgi:hypothetical protein